MSLQPISSLPDEWELKMLDGSLDKFMNKWLRQTTEFKRKKVINNYV